MPTTLDSGMRTRTTSLAVALAQHLCRHGLAWALALLAAFLFRVQFTIGINASPSLPYHLFLIHVGEMPARDDYVAFTWHGGGPYRAGITFVKILAGLPGDTVTTSGRTFFVNDRPVGVAKRTSRSGAPLDPGPVGRLPEGRYYVRAPHPDSLDSRYAITGWIARDRILGRAYALF